MAQATRIDYERAAGMAAMLMAGLEKIKEEPVSWNDMEVLNIMDRLAETINELGEYFINNA